MSLPASNASLGASELDCSLVNVLANDSIGRCTLVNTFNDCQTGRALLPYIDFLYCYTGPWPLPGLLLWLATLFIALGSTASSYLCPALVVISKSLQLSQGVAGVTFLAFGNGAPDTIATITSIRMNRTALAIGELFGGGTYVATVVVGLIFVSNKFELIQSSLLRDILFYLAASYWAFLLYLDGSIRVADAVGFIVLYLVYITVAVFGQSVLAKAVDLHLYLNSLLHKPSLRGSEELSEEQSGDGASMAEVDDTVTSPPPLFARPRLRRSSSGVSLHHHHENAIYYFTTSVEEQPADVLQQSQADSERLRLPSYGSQASFNFARSSSSVFADESTPLLGRSLISSPEKSSKPVPENGQWIEFLLQISPAEPREWKSKKLYSKLYDVLTFPIHLVLVLTIPVVDRENRRSNWCRPLNALQCITIPMLALGLFGVFWLRIGEVVPVWTLGLALGSMLAVLVLLTSTADRPPCYHVVFAYVGFSVSIIWIYGLATEIVALLKAFGVLYGISDILLGMTVLAWGNNIGDLVTNLSLAKQGFPQMAMSACFAGPVLALLLGFGVAFSINFTTRGLTCIELQYSDLLAVIYGALVVVLAILLLCMLATWFRSTRAVGVSLILLYATFLLATGLVEFKYTSAGHPLF